MRSSRFSALALAAIMSIGFTALPADYSLTSVVEAAAEAEAPENLAVSVTSTSVTLSWDEADGADAYRVYQYDATKKKFVKIKTIKASSTSTTITGLKTNKKYYFKVSSLVKYGKTYKEAAVSDKVSATPKQSKKTAVTKKAETTKKPVTTKKTTTKKTQQAGELPKLPKGMTTVFRETGYTATEIKGKLDEDFEKVRFKIINLGYKFKPVDSTNDVRTYVGQYEVRYNDELVYIFYEKYVQNGTVGDGWVWMEDMHGNVVFGKDQVVVTTTEQPKWGTVNATAFYENGGSQVEVEGKLRKDFENVRYKLVNMGYSIKPTSSSTDLNSYSAVYDVRANDTLVGKYYERYDSQSTYGYGWVWVEDLTGHVVIGSSSYNNGNVASSQSAFYNGTPVVIVY